MKALARSGISAGRVAAQCLYNVKLERTRAPSVREVRPLRSRSVFGCPVFYKHLVPPGPVESKHSSGTRLMLLRRSWAPASLNECWHLEVGKTYRSRYATRP